MTGRVLVTGAAGFVGSHVVEALLAEGREVVGLDAFVPYYPRPVKEANLARARADARFTFHELDLRSDDLAPALDGVDAVVHEAAMAGLVASWTDTATYVACNVMGTYRLLEAIETAGIRRLVHVSTSSVYGREATGDETTPTRPTSPYGVSKLAGEHLVQAFVEERGLPATILRYYSIYGPRQRPDMGYHLFIEALLDGREITVYGDGEQTRTSTFVADCVAGTLAALEAEAVGGVYNIGGGEAASVSETIALLGRLVGVEPRIRRAAPRAGDQRHTRAVTERARVDLGYQPRVGLEEGLAAQVAWHRARRAGAA